MKPRTFNYVAAKTLTEALAILRAHGDDAKVIAGGQSLVPMMNMRLVSPAVLVDIGALTELRSISTEGDVLRIGALARHRDVQESSLVRTHAPLLSQAVELVAHLAVRNRGTLGGSLCHADPVAEFPACALLLDAELEVASTTETRVVRADGFFQGAFTTALEPHEMLVGIRVPFAATGTTFLIDEVSRRQGDFAMAGLAASIETQGSRRIRLVGFGCSDRPVRLPASEALFSGRKAAVTSRDLDMALARDMEGEPNGERETLARYLLRTLLTRHFPVLHSEAA